MLSVMLHCWRCDSRFRIDFAYLSEKQELACPNCGQKVEPEPFDALVNGARHLLVAQKTMESHFELGMPERIYLTPDGP